MTMNFADMPLRSVSDVDAQLRDVVELRGLLDGFFPAIASMLAVLARREQSLRDCRQELVATPTTLPRVQLSSSARAQGRTNVNHEGREPRSQRRL
jgi:hypothetical protein